MAEAKVLSGAGLRPGGRPDSPVHRRPGRRRPDLPWLRRPRPGGGGDLRGVAYLLLYGELPNKQQLDAYLKKLQGQRDLPQALKEVLERIPRTPTRWT